MLTRNMSRRGGTLAIGVLGCLALPAMAMASEPAEAAPASPAVIDVLLTANNVWMMICAGLVFIMHLGFASLESGLTRAKNTVNILTKNTAIIAIGLLTYFVVGFNLMYPGDFLLGQWLGFAGFGIATDANGLSAAYAEAGYTYWTDFLFQAMFAATAATIISGAVAERIKIFPFLLFSMLFVGLLYPWIGSWQWGGGWLEQSGFYDFAGSTLVHAVGGWGALAGVIILGARIGRYGPNGRINPIPGHSMPLATMGVFLLWLGWFGFNGGSVLSADPGETSLVLVTTALAAAAGALAGLFTANFVLGRLDLTMGLNGVLAGLVGITAGANLMSPAEAIIIGAIAGVLVVLSCVLLDRLRLDDPVGAISVHLTCGIWGTLAVGIFGTMGLIRGEAGLMAGVAQLGYQAVGVLVCGAAAFGFALATFGAIRATMGLRVSREEELEGLDRGEHGMAAYPDFIAARPATVSPPPDRMEGEPVAAPALVALASPELA